MIISFKNKLRWSYIAFFFFLSYVTKKILLLFFKDYTIHEKLYMHCNTHLCKLTKNFTCMELQKINIDLFSKLYFYGRWIILWCIWINPSPKSSHLHQKTLLLIQARWFNQDVRLCLFILVMFETEHLDFFEPKIW